MRRVFSRPKSIPRPSKAPSSSPISVKSRRQCCASSPLAANFPIASLGSSLRNVNRDTTMRKSDMNGRAFYADSIESFLSRGSDELLGVLSKGGSFSVEINQRDAWLAQIEILRESLHPYRMRGTVFFEYSVPRLGKRIDLVAIIDHVVFVIEFKIGATEFAANAIDQVWDYALDLKNFHETSHDKPMAPILVATGARRSQAIVASTHQSDGLLLPIQSTAEELRNVIEAVLSFCDGPPIDVEAWAQERYRPTPTIIEAATALYGGHAVSEIARSDASATNLSLTSQAISTVIGSAKALSRKSICFVTGVPGAGKTLVGLDIATKHFDKSSDLYSVFLSGKPSKRPAPACCICRPIRRT
jgi:hypothetical protein